MLKLKKYHTKIPSDLKYISGTIIDIISFIEEVNGAIDECVIFELKVILNELILNAIKHGNKYEVNKVVKATINVSKQGYVFFCIEDEGEGYDYRHLLKSYRNALNIVDSCGVKETGRGMLIVSNLCESIKFNKCGNKVLVLKRI